MHPKVMNVLTQSNSALLKADTLDYLAIISIDNYIKIIIRTFIFYNFLYFTHLMPIREF